MIFMVIYIFCDNEFLSYLDEKRWITLYKTNSAKIQSAKVMNEPVYGTS